jgi:cytochrome c553
MLKGLAAICVFASVAAAQDAPSILKQNCSPCHGSALTSSGLDLRSRDTAIRGGSRGAALVPGKAEESRLYRYAAHLEEPHMPPNKPLTADQVKILKDWINQGATWAADTQPIPSEDAAAALARLEDRPIKPQERKWWAFQPVQRPAVPALAANPSLNPVDAFLRVKWREKSLTPAKAADRRSLVRRLYLDVLGLPPTIAQVEAFLADRSPKAYENLVDGLLASPHYGERWARHWMDVVRYADSGGYEYDRDRDNAWRYRDYVVNSLNADKPYDKFLLEQLAGDEIWPDSQEARIATGMLRLGPENNLKNEQTRLDELDDLIATTSNSLLGLTVGCARCHNHKFDPIPQKDYYKLQAVFWSTKPEEYPLASAEEVARHKAEAQRIDKAQQALRAQINAILKPYKDAYVAERKSKLAPYLRAALDTPAEQRNEGQKLNVIQVEKTLSAIPEDLPNRLNPTERASYDKLKAEIDALDKQKPQPFPTAMAIAEKWPNETPARFLHRGSAGQKGSVMAPGVISVTQESEWPFPAPPEGAKSSHRREHFARWVVDPKNPLTSRVMVNRIWQQHFGEGLVRTPNNFGKMGERPTHPELLDYLASEFVAQGWRMKPIHKLILMSEAYRMASDDSAVNLAKDPENRLLWRMPRRRVEGEILRDSILAVSGSLDPKVGGPGVFPYIDPSLFQASSKRTWNGKPDADTDPSTWRRSLYVFSKRSIPLPMLEVFDKPDTIGSCARRNRSTVSPQALILMNNGFMAIHARRFAARLDAESKGDTTRLIELAFEHALARKPSPTELAKAKEFLGSSAASPINNLQDFCQALFNINEFVYIL